MENNFPFKRNVSDFNTFFSIIIGTFFKKFFEKKMKKFRYLKKNIQKVLFIFKNDRDLVKFNERIASKPKKKHILNSKKISFLNQKFYKILCFFFFYIKFSKNNRISFYRDIFFEKFKNKIVKRNMSSSKKKSSSSYSLRKFLIRSSKQKNNIVSKQKDTLLPNKKFKNKEKILNMKSIYDRLNYLLDKNSIKGFTYDSFRLLAFILEQYFSVTLKKLRNIAIFSREKKKKEWGVKNISLLKKEPGQLLLKNKNMEKQEKNFFKLIKLFRKKKKKMTEKKQEKNYLSRIFLPKEVTKKKSIRKKIIDENIIKTNKTLMTLLGGILRRRIRILREATKCLCKYKPMPLKINIQNRNEKHLEFQKKPDYLFKKKNSFMKNHGKLAIDYEHCLIFLKSMRLEEYPKFFSKWFFSVIIDNNIKDQEKTV